MKKLFLILTSLVYLLGVAYLTLPAPQVPSLPNATLSDEPGDTWQNPKQTAYFTNWQRHQVVTYLQDAFALRLSNLKLPSYRLNYRPEEANIYVRKHIDSYYLEEIVHPLRESLFVHGWNPSKSPQNSHLPPQDLKKQLIVINGEKYNAKVILNPYSSSVITRLLIWTAIFPATYFVFRQLSLTSRQLTSQLLTYLRQR